MLSTRTGRDAEAIRGSVKLQPHEGVVIVLEEHLSGQSTTLRRNRDEQRKL